MEELPTIDFNLSVNNKDRAFDIENEESSVNFLEIGQNITVLYGQELEDGSVEWLPGAKVQLKEWSADDEEMTFPPLIGLTIWTELIIEVCIARTESVCMTWHLTCFPMRN